MNKDPNNPFNWRMRTEPSIFYNDPQFRARKEGKSNSELQTEVVERKRADGELYGHIYGVGPSAKEDERLLAYKQFGTNVKNGKSTKKPNKHEK